MVAPAVIFLKHYLEKTKCNIDIEEFIKDSINNWNQKIENIINKTFIKNMENHKILNLFRGDYADTACYDLESKIIESGVFNCIIHEKKNFSHGRFINYENLNNTCSLNKNQQQIMKKNY